MGEALALVRRRDATRTKSSIVNAARQVFAQRGFDQAGIREIALVAGVDSSLIRRYFGSKAGLFEAALTENLQQILHAAPLLTDKAGAGIKIARHIATDDSNIGFQLQTLSPSDLRARAIGTRLIEQQIMPPLAAWIGTEDGEQRARDIYIICAGLCVFRQHFIIDEVTISWYGKMLQDLIDGS